MEKYKQNIDYSKKIESPEPPLICPICRKKIPIFTFLYQKDHIMLSIECSCTEKHSDYSIQDYINKLKQNDSVTLSKCIKHDNPSDKFCSECNQSLCLSCIIDHNTSQNLKKHLLCDYELTLCCSEHRSNYSLYCHTCNNHICPDCKNAHQSHNTFPIGSNTLNEVKQHIDEIIKAYPILGLEMHLFKLCIIKTHIITHNHPLYYLTNLWEALNNFKLQLPKTQIKKPQKLIGHTEKVVGIIELITGELVSYSFDCTIIIWDVTNYTLKAKLSGHTKYIAKVIEFDNNRIVSCAGDYSIKVWNTLTYKCMSTLMKYEKLIIDMSKVNSDLLICKLLDCTILVWDINSSCVKEICSKEPCYSMNSFQVVFDERKLFIHSQDKNKVAITQYDVSSKKLKLLFEFDYDEQINKLEYLRNGRLLLKTESKIDLCSLNDGDTQRILTSNDCNFSIEIYPGTLAVIRSQNKVEFFNLSTFRCNSVLHFDPAYDYLIRLFKLSDGRLVAFTRSVIYIINPITYQCRIIIPGHSKYITTVIEIFKGKLASLSWDYTMKIWCTYSLELVLSLSVNMNWIPFVLSNERIAIVTKEEDSAIEIW